MLIKRAALHTYRGSALIKSEKSSYIHTREGYSCFSFHSHWHGDKSEMYNSNFETHSCPYLKYILYI